MSEVSGKHLEQVLHLLGPVVAYHVGLTRLTGKASATLFMSQLYYWSDRGKDPDGWVYKSHAEMEEETGLTRQEQRTARNILVGLGILEEQLKQPPGRDVSVVHFRINFDALVRLAYEKGLLKRESGVRKPAETLGLLPATTAWLEATTARLDPTIPTYTKNTAENTADILPEASGRFDRPADFWDAMVAVVGYKPNPTQRGSWAKAIKVIKDMGGDPVDILARGRLYEQRFRGAITPMALAKWWQELGKPQKNGTIEWSGWYDAQGRIIDYDGHGHLVVADTEEVTTYMGSLAELKRFHEEDVDGTL